MRDVDVLRPEGCLRSVFLVPQTVVLIGENSDDHSDGVGPICRDQRASAHTPLATWVWQGGVRNRVGAGCLETSGGVDNRDDASEMVPEAIASSTQHREEPTLHDGGDSVGVSSVEELLHCVEQITGLRSRGFDLTVSTTALAGIVCFAPLGPTLEEAVREWLAVLDSDHTSRREVMKRYGEGLLKRQTFDGPGEATVVDTTAGAQCEDVVFYGLVWYVVLRIVRRDLKVRVKVADILLNVADRPGPVNEGVLLLLVDVVVPLEELAGRWGRRCRHRLRWCFVG